MSTGESSEEALDTRQTQDFAAWVRPHLTAMSLLAARLVPPPGTDRLVQEAIVQAWRRRSSSDAGTRPPGAFLLGVVADRGRRRRRRDSSRRQTLELVDEAATGVATADRDRDLESALARLPARPRLAVDLHYFVGLHVVDCAAVLRTSSTEVETLLRRARSRLPPVSEPDLLDRRLREYGHRWRVGVPAPDVELELPDEQLTPGCAALLVAAGVALLVAFSAWLVTSTGKSARLPPEPPLTPTSTGLAVDLEGLVLWRLLPQRDPRDGPIPDYEVKYDPEPVDSSYIPDCRIPDVSATSEASAGPDGSRLLRVVFSAAEGSQCRMSYTPGLFLYDPDGSGIDVQVRPPTRFTGWPGEPIVEDDQQAVLELAWSDWCEPAVTNAGLALMWAGLRLEVGGFGPSPDCSRPLGASTVEQGTFQPVQWRRYSGDPLLRPLRVRQVGYADGTVSVELLATARDLSLEECPDVRVVQHWPDRDPTVQTFGLNCDGVRYRDELDRPYLPRGRPVTFLMEPDLVRVGSVPVSLTLVTPRPITLHLDLE